MNFVDKDRTTKVYIPVRPCKSQAEIKYSFSDFRVYLLKESTSSRQDLDELVTNIPQLIEYGAFVRLYQHQSNVFWNQYSHLGLLL